MLLPDTGRQYLSKVYSDSWMLQYGMLDRPESIRVEEVLSAKHGELPPLITVGAHDEGPPGGRPAAGSTASRRRRSCARRASDVAQFVGSIRDRELLERMFRDPDALQADVAEVMAPPIPMVEFDDPVESAFGELEHGPPCSSRRRARCSAC